MTNYKDKNVDYFSNSRTDILKLVNNNSNNKVLEIGASGAYTLYALKKMGKATYVAGIDLFEINDSKQKDPLIDYFKVTNITEHNLDFEKESFDIIICADVLEHLLHPQETLTYLTRFLKKDGQLIISLPNIRNFRPLIKIIFNGTFEYTESGIMDYTHLRFFCKKNMEKLILNSGLKIKKSYSDLELLDKKHKIHHLNNITYKLFEEFLTVQFLFDTTK